jgi:cytoskeletal protein RodZ
VSDRSQGPGWWLASDGRWYPPTQRSGAESPPLIAPDPASAVTTRERRRVLALRYWQAIAAATVIFLLGIGVGAAGNSRQRDVTAATVGTSRPAKVTTSAPATTTTSLPTTTSSVPATTTTAATAPPTTPPPTTPAPAPAPAQRTVPGVAGQRLDVARVHLHDAGYVDTDIEVIGGGTFGVIVEANWLVCSTEPSPGAPADHVRLIVDRTC